MVTQELIEALKKIDEDGKREVVVMYHDRTLKSIQFFDVSFSMKHKGETYLVIEERE